MNLIKKHIFIAFCLLLINNLAVFSSSDKQIIFQDKDIKITQKQIKTDDKFFEQNFKLYKIEFNNKSNINHHFEGIIFNQVTAKEAEAKFKQIEYEQKETRKKIAIVGAIGFIGTTAVSAVLSPSLVLWGILQKVVSTPLINQTDKYFLERLNKEFVNKLEEGTSQELFYEFDLQKDETTELYYLLPSSEQIEGVFAFRFSKGNKNEYQTISHKLKKELAKRIFTKPTKEIFQSSFVDSNLLKDKPYGAYVLTNNKLSFLKESNIESLTKSADQDELIAIENSLEQKINIEKSKIYIYQNIFRMPKRHHLTLHKINNPKDNKVTHIKGNLVRFALKEIEPGVMQLQSPKKNKLDLAPSKYAIVQRNNDKSTQVYYFSVYNQ